METNKPEAGNTAAENNDITDYLSDVQQIEKEGYQLGVKKARNALFWAAGLLFLGEIIAMARAGFFDPASTALGAVISGIFIALAFWTKKKPYTAIVTGLIVFIAYWLFVIVANGILDGAEGVGKAIIGGIIIRIIIIVNLVRSLQDAKELQQAMQGQ
jgi:hypothetical protein